MIVRVSNRDRHEADLLAQDTVKLLESMGVTPRLENKQQSRIEANRLGFMAEFAVCRLFGAEPPRLNIATDGGVDLWLGDISVDVKFSKTGSDQIATFASFMACHSLGSDGVANFAL